MVKRKIESHFYGESTFFINEDTGHEYIRISGGIGFPYSSKPGIVVVLAEELTRKRGQKPNFWALAHAEDFNPGRLFRVAAGMVGRYHIDRFYCDIEDRGMTDFLYRSKISLPISGPPYLGENTALNSYISLIRTLTEPGQKRLHLGGSLGSQLLAIPADKIKTARAQDWPLIQSLGGCLAAMIVWKFDPQEQRTVDILNDSLSEMFDY